MIDGPIAAVRDAGPAARRSGQRDHLIGPASLGAEGAASPLLTGKTMANGNPNRLAFAYRSKLAASRLQRCRKDKDAAGCLAAAAEYEALKPTDAGGLYDAACNRAVCAAVILEDPKTPGADAPRLAKEQADLAMAWLHKAVAAGFKDAEHIKQDKDLDALRGREDFKKLLAEWKAKKK